MGCENISSKRSSNSISILVVDDDTTCLSLVATLLKKFKYEVVTAKHPNDALCALRIKGGAFDLVVSDVNMPDMNGFELQEAIMHEFNLPVVLMSVDSKEGVVSKGLKTGAAFFISKPVSPNDLKDLWQFATSNMRKKRHLIVNNNNKKENPKRNSKKPKVIWTNGLNCRFLEAIRSIGLERSVPKRILEVMNVPGLTRENVASHLQKYRMFLKRVSDASYKVEDGGGLISRNYSVQTLNSSLNKPQFPPSSSSSYQMNSLIKDDEPIIPRFNSPYSTTNPSLHTNIDHASILGQISSQMGNSSEIFSPPFPSTQKSGSYLNFHSYELQNNLVNQYLGDSSNVGDYRSIPSPFSSVYDDLLLPSFDTTQQSFNPNHHQLTIQNQAQRDGCEYTENSIFSDDGIGITNSSHDDHQPFYQQVEGLEESLQCDDDVLEFLLAFGPFGEDQIQTLEGI